MYRGTLAQDFLFQFFPLYVQIRSHYQKMLYESGAQVVIFYENKTDQKNSRLWL
jgi:hypothetical protein